MYSEKCESRTSLHAVQYKWQPGSILMFCSYYFKNGYPRHCYYALWESKPSFVLSLFLIYFTKIKAFVLYVLWDNKPSFVLSLLWNFFAKIKAFVLIKLLCKKDYTASFEIEIIQSKFWNIFVHSFQLFPNKILSGEKNMIMLTQFRLSFPFHTPWKHQKTSNFVVFSGGIKNNTGL